MARGSALLARETILKRWNSSRILIYRYNINSFKLILNMTILSFNFLVVLVL